MMLKCGTYFLAFVRLCALSFVCGYADAQTVQLWFKAAPTVWRIVGGAQNGSLQDSGHAFIYVVDVDARGTAHVREGWGFYPDGDPSLWKVVVGDVPGVVQSDLGHPGQVF